MENIKNIKIQKKHIDKMIKHCKRKLQGVYEKDETKEKQAFGMIIGKQKNDVLYITRIVELKHNYRFNETISKKMDKLIKEYAIPGGLNISERAWAIDPVELLAILNSLDKGEKIIATYHMHHDKSWKGKYPRQLPTKLDRKLSENTNLYSFIVYVDIVNNKNSVRSFWEAKIECEKKIEILEEIKNEDYC